LGVVQIASAPSATVTLVVELLLATLEPLMTWPRYP